MVCLRCQLIREMRLAMTRLYSTLSHEAVSFQREQVSAHRIISQPEFFREFINSPRGTTQQADNTAARAFKKSFIQRGHLHTYPWSAIYILRLINTISQEGS